MLSARGYYERAAEALSAWVRLAPEGHFALGTLRFQAGDRPGAASTLDRAVELAPREARVLLNAGVAHRSAGNLQRARQLCESLLELHPEHPQAPSIRN